MWLDEERTDPSLFFAKALDDLAPCARERSPDRVAILRVLR
jgi:hypothetical protein